MILGFRVSPGAKRTELKGLYGDRVKVAVAAPPENDRANEELLRSVARWLGLSRHQVRIYSGSTSRDKALYLVNIDEAELRRRLGQLLSADLGQ